MKNKILTFYAVAMTLAVGLMTYKYFNLRSAYHKAESQKVEYCIKYHKELCKKKN